MSKRKHIPDDKLPPKPKACSRIILPSHTELTKECLRIVRDRADRALQEIIRIRVQLPFLDQKITLFSDKEKVTSVDNSGSHKITLAELNTLLTELACILDQAYSLKKSSKGDKQKFNHRTSHRSIKNIRSPSISFPFNDINSIPHHPRLTKPEPAAQLIRRNELFEVEKG